jgi:hypothetical protein
LFDIIIIIIIIIVLLLLSSSFIFAGDPCKHPLFATSTEDLEGHPLTEAFRCLREEDKTNLELAIMYKIEGNEWLQKKTKKSYIESYLRYTHAISFIDKAIIEKEDKGSLNNDNIKYSYHGDDNDNNNNNNNNKSDGGINNTTVAFNNSYDNINNNEINSKDNNNKDYNNIQELYILKSQLYSNRALTCYNLNNYRRCYLDCDEAIKYYSMNMKAYYRKCQAFIKLKKLNECLLTCNEYLYHYEQQQQHDNNNNNDSTKKESSSDIMLKMKEQVQQMILTIEKNKNDSYKNLLFKLINKWSYVWDICSIYNITLGYPLYSLSEPIELRECWWYNDDDDDEGVVDASSGVVDDSSSCMIRCPVLLNYPQYGTYDVITSACVNDCLIDHLDILFPEREDCSNNDQYHHQHSDRHVHWDINDEYHVSNLSIYIQLNMTQSITSKQQWLEACMEYYILMQGGNIELLQFIRNDNNKIIREGNSSNRGSTSTSTNSSGVIDYKKLKSIVDKRENLFFENMNTSDCSNSNQIRFLEVYIGCNLLSIAKAYHISNILSRGIINLIIYPKNHHLHKIFKEQNKNKIGYLHPN